MSPRNCPRDLREDEHTEYPKLIHDWDEAGEFVFRGCEEYWKDNKGVVVTS